MIRIQTYNSAPRRIQAGGINPGNQPALRTVSGRAEDRTLAAMLQSGLKLTDIAVKEYVQNETTRVEQSLADMNTELAAERERYMRENQGQNALNAGEHFEQFARNLRDKTLAGGKFQGRFADIFMKQASGLGFNFTEQGRSYARQQRGAWYDSVKKSMVSEIMNLAAQDYDDPDKIAYQLESYKFYLDTIQHGLDNRGELNKVFQNVAETRVDGYLAHNRIADARDAFEESRDMLGDRANTVKVRIDARADALQARAEADAKRAEQRETRRAVRSAVRDILKNSDGFPSQEEQRDAALTRAEAVKDPELRQKARAEIERELDWRMLRRDARTMRAMLDFRSAARSEGLSPEQRYERLEREDMPEDVRAALFDELERGEERVPNEENMRRAMNLLRFIDAARAGGRAPTADDILAAGLRGGLTDGQVEGALAYLENDGMLSLSHLDDICLDLGMAPDEHGEVRAPAWLYEGVLRDLARNGQTGSGVITDEMLANSATRVRQRHDARIAAGGAHVVKTGTTDALSSPILGPFWQSPPVPSPMLEGEVPPTAPTSLGDALEHGLQDSVSGLWWREQLPDILTQRDLEALSPAGRLALTIGQTVGNLPTLASGGLLGTLGGMASPLTIPAGAMGLTEGTRSVLKNAIRQGSPQSLEQFAERMGDNLTAMGKAMTVGAATGLAGAGAGAAVRAVGGRAVAQEAGRLAAEAVTMPTVAAGMEGRLPDAQDFADAAALILGMKALGGAGKAAGRMLQGGRDALEARLKSIHEQTGIGPEQVLSDAAKNPALQVELASGKQKIPSYYAQGSKVAQSESGSLPVLAKPVLEKAKAGEYVDTETLVQLAGPRPWAQALLNERLGMGRLKEKLAVIFDRAERRDLSTDALPWQFVSSKEAALLSEKTGWKIEGGFTHTIAPQQVWHAVKRHGKDGESFLEYPNQVPVTRDDIAMLPELIRPENIVRGEKSRSGSPVIIYKKSTPDGFTLYCEEVRTGKKQLAFKTMYKVKK